MRLGDETEERPGQVPTPRGWIIVGRTAVVVSSVMMPIIALLDLVLLLNCSDCSGDEKWWIFYKSIAGWILALTSVFGMARAMRRDQFGWLWRGVAAILLIGAGGAIYWLRWLFHW